MSDGPLLSFIVLSYNYADCIGITIQSILDQTVGDFEIVVVDDASRDRSCDVIRGFGDDRIHLLVNDRNIGGAASYNRAVQAATGKYLVNLDADDWIVPDKTERQLAALARQPVDILGTYAHFVDREGEPHPRAWELEQLINQPHDLNSARTWIGHNNLVRSTTMVERAAHLRIGLDDPGMVRAPDFELWTRALRAGCRFGVLAEPLTYYRLHPDGVTRGDATGTFLEMSYAVLRNLLPLVEAGENDGDLALIARWILERRQNIEMPSRQWHRLLGMLIQTPTFRDFSDFANTLGAGNDAAGLDTAGRRLLALLGPDIDWSQLKKLQGELAAVSDARDFWHRTSDEWEEQYRALQRQGHLYHLLRTVVTRLRQR